MRGFAKLTIAGNLTRDPDLRSTANGRSVASFGVAVNRNRKDASGNMNEEVTFYNCSAWGQQAENINKYLHKGDPILLSGRPHQSNWRDRNGAERSSIEVEVDDFVFLGGGNRDNNSGSSSYPAPAGSTVSSDDFVPNDIPDGEVALDNPFDDSAPTATARAAKDAQDDKATKDSKAKDAKGTKGAALSSDTKKEEKNPGIGEVVLDEDMSVGLDEVPF